MRCFLVSRLLSVYNIAAVLVALPFGSVATVEKLRQDRCRQAGLAPDAKTLAKKREQDLLFEVRMKYVYTHPEP